jgi:hypothetical protein
VLLFVVSTVVLNGAHAWSWELRSRLCFL